MKLPLNGTSTMIKLDINENDFDNEREIHNYLKSNGYNYTVSNKILFDWEHTIGYISDIYLVRAISDIIREKNKDKHIISNKITINKIIARKIIMSIWEEETTEKTKFILDQLNTLLRIIETKDESDITLKMSELSLK